MIIPDDLIVDLRQGELRLSSGGKTITIEYKSYFRDGPITFSRLMLYLQPAFWHLSQQETVPK